MSRPIGAVLESGIETFSEKSTGAAASNSVISGDKEERKKKLQKGAVLMLNLNQLHRLQNDITCGWDAILVLSRLRARNFRFPATIFNTWKGAVGLWS